MARHFPGLVDSAQIRVARLFADLDKDHVTWFVDPRACRASSDTMDAQCHARPALALYSMGYWCGRAHPRPAVTAR